MKNFNDKKISQLSPVVSKPIQYKQTFKCSSLYISINKIYIRKNCMEVSPAFVHIRTKTDTEANLSVPFESFQ